MSLLERRLVLITLGLVFLLGLALRISGMNRSFWIDEILTYRVAREEIEAALTLTYYPLSYVLVHLALLLGDAEAILRLPSWIAGLLAIPAIYFLGNAVGGRLVGVLAAFFLAVSPIHISYSQDGRFYSIMVLAASLALFFLLQGLRKGDWRWWAAFAVAVALGTLNHPFFSPFLACAASGAGISILLLRKGKRGKVILALVLATAAGLAPVIASYSAFVQRRPDRARLINPGNPQARSYTLGVTQYGAFACSLLNANRPAEAVPLAGLLLVGAAALVRRRSQSAGPLLAACFLMPVPFFFVPVTHWHSSKYFIGQLAPALVLVATGLVALCELLSRFLFQRVIRLHAHSRLSRRGGAKLLTWEIGLFTAVLLGALLEFYRGVDTEKRKNWLGVTSEMKLHMGASDLVIHFAPESLDPNRRQDISHEPTEVSLNFYLQRQLGMSGRRDLFPTRHLATLDPAQVNEWLRDNPTETVWIVQKESGWELFERPEDRELWEQRLKTPHHTLWVRGAPTENLLENGGYEKPLEEVTSGVMRIRSNRGSRARTHMLQLVNSRPGDAATHELKVHPPARHLQNGIPESGAGPVLSPGEPYTLSFRMRYEDAPGTDFEPPPIAISLTGTTDKKRWRQEVAGFFGYGDWKFHSFPISSTRYPEIAGAEEINVEFRVAGVRGRAWVDEVQLEQGEHPRPFVEDLRLPHDKALAQFPHE